MIKGTCRKKEITQQHFYYETNEQWIENERGKALVIRKWIWHFSKILRGIIHCILNIYSNKIGIYCFL